MALDASPTDGHRTLRDFFANLASDQAKLDAYRNDPVRVMIDEGVSDDDRLLVMRGDLVTIRRRIDEESRLEGIVARRMIAGS